MQIPTKLPADSERMSPGRRAPCSKDFLQPVEIAQGVPHSAGNSMSAAPVKQGSGYLELTALIPFAFEEMMRDCLPRPRPPGFE